MLRSLRPPVAVAACAVKILSAERLGHAVIEMIQATRKEG